MQNHVKRRLNNNINVNVMASIAISAMLIFSVAGIKAFADNVEDDIQVSPPERTITIPGTNADGTLKDASTTVKYWVKENSAGGLQGCDASDGSPVTITFQFPRAAVSASSDSLSFSECGDSSTNTKSVTYTSNKVGDYPISVSAADAAGRYNTGDATFILHVRPPVADTTDPTISITSPSDGATLTSDSVTVEGTASDSGSGLEKVEVQVNGGSYSAASGTSTWSSSVTLGEGPNTITAQATDKAGNTATDSVDVTYTPPDITPPTLKVPTTPVIAEATGPNGATVSYAELVSATDDRDPSPTITCTPASGSTFALGTTEVTCDATDAAGNNAEPAKFSVTVQDTTAPKLTVPSDMSIKATGVDGATVTYTATATDAVDTEPTVTCTPASGSTVPVGTTTVSCTATDDSGNTSPAATFKVSVTLTMAGFYQPVDMGSTMNTVKGGSTVPFKFEIFAGSTELTSTTLNGNPIGSFSAKKVACPGGAAEDPIEQVVTATGGTVLRYDSTSGQFVYNWQTPKQPNACYDVIFTSLDGTTLTAHFKLK